MKLTFNGFERLKGVEVYSYEDIKYEYTEDGITIDNFLTMATVKISK